MDRSKAQGSDERQALRLTPTALLQRAVDSQGGTANRALLLMRLNRSDRLAALAQQPSARVVLGEIARRVQGVLRPSDRYAVAAIDEVWLLLAEVPNQALAELAGKTLRDSIARPVLGSGESQGQTIAQMRPVIGGAWYSPGVSPDPMDLLGAAAKLTRDAVGSEEQVLVAAPGLMRQAVDRSQLAAELRNALQSNELEVHFQPQVDLERGRCTGAEALVRWARPQSGPVNPALIASVAEERGLMGYLTQFVLNTALRSVMTWSSLGIDSSVSINLSSVTLSDTGYAMYVDQALSTWGVAPERLTLELTEGLIVENERAAQEFIRQVRATGCRLALDDFGTGYSSFDYLRKFSMDELKIDQSFVRDIGKDRDDLRIVRALIDVAHTFDLKALAEGIESPEVARKLRDAGCDLGQGYLFAQALPPDEFVQWYLAFNKQPAGAALAVP